MLERLTRDKKWLFWTLQLGGWSGYAVLNYLNGIAHGKLEDYWIPSVIYALGGVVITWALRWVFKAVWNRPPLTIAMIGGLGVALAASMFSGFRSFVYVHIYERWEFGTLPLADYFELWDLYLSLYVIISWSGFYFGIKYYRMSQRQNEQVLKATSAAHEAQLKMLRYQLNPHFLFNTLNAISTLVLEGDADTANRMVTRLSQFLRYSLDRDPMQKVSLRKELDALDLYLTIERIRFEERLDVAYQIAPEVERALVPSMILQPLIENAIKYAIAHREEGGHVTIRAALEEGMLCLRITDDGPGIDNIEEALTRRSNGVGLANTRERLQVLYGPRQKMTLENLSPNGLSVKLCLPFENSES